MCAHFRDSPQAFTRQIDDPSVENSDYSHAARDQPKLIKLLINDAISDINVAGISMSATDITRWLGRHPYRQRPVPARLQQQNAAPHSGSLRLPHRLLRPHRW